MRRLWPYMHTNHGTSISSTSSMLPVHCEILLASSMSTCYSCCRQWSQEVLALLQGATPKGDAWQHKSSPKRQLEVGDILIGPETTLYCNIIHNYQLIFLAFPAGTDLQTLLPHIPTALKAQRPQALNPISPKRPKP